MLECPTCHSDKYPWKHEIECSQCHKLIECNSEVYLAGIYGLTCRECYHALLAAQTTDENVREN